MISIRPCAKRGSGFQHGTFLAADQPDRQRPAAGRSFALAFRDVYTFGPTFRAENSNTPSCCRIWMIEPEMAFADLQDDMRMAEALIKYLIAYVLEHCPQEMEFLNSFVDKGLQERLLQVVQAEFARITYSEAVDLLLQSKATFEYPVAWGHDLQTEHERYLTEKIFNKTRLVTDYPQKIKAFYMRLNDDGKTVAAMDSAGSGCG
jgi:asparaginyl-tRNA synthetase